MSTISSDLSAAMKQRRDLRARSRAARRAPSGTRPTRAAIALAFLMFSQISSWPISFMKPPISVSAVRGTGSPVIGSLPSTAFSRSQPRVPSASFASGMQDRVLDEAR